MALTIQVANEPNYRNKAHNSIILLATKATVNQSDAKTHNTAICREQRTVIHKPSNN